MAIGSDTFAVPFGEAPYPVRRFTVDEYLQMVDAGILTEDDRVELLEGWITPKMVHKPPHDLCIELIDETIRPHVPSEWRIRIQSAIVTRDSQPEPDLAIVRGSARDRRGRHPSPDEIALVVEVAESSLRRDRDKCRIYANARIPMYWIVNLVDGQSEVCSEPIGTGETASYAEQAVVPPGGEIALRIGDEQLAKFAASDLLP